MSNSIISVCQTISKKRRNNQQLCSRASAEKFPGEGNGKKTEKSKNDRKIALLSLFHEGGPREKRPKIAKKDRKIALCSLFVPCMKIQWGHAPPAPAAEAHDCAAPWAKSPMSEAITRSTAGKIRC